MGRGNSKSEQGVFLIFLGIGVVILLAALSFAIDIPQKEVVSHELRLAIDAASLGGAQKLDGSVFGLRDAVDAIDQVMLKNRVAGETLKQDDYQIEFGFYSFPSKDFRVLGEGSTYRTFDDDNPPIEEEGGIPISALTNSVRVRGSAVSPSAFAGIFGFLNLGTVQGEAVATANKNPKVCAFPFAIPICSLFLNQDPNRLDRVTTPGFEGEVQCKRPLFIANSNYEYEAEALGDQMRNDRFGGFARSTFYSRPQQVNFNPQNVCGNGQGIGANCLHTPIMGTFVAPIGRDIDGDGDLDGDVDNTGLSIDNFIAMLKTMLAKTRTDGEEFCVDFQIGEVVSPLENARLLKPGNGEITDTIMRRLNGGANEADEIDQLFYELIYGNGSMSFKEAFGDAQTGVGVQPNYPFQRNDDVDRVEGYGNVKVLTPAMGSWQWTNPLCHSKIVPANDPDNARVRRVVVPLVAPSAESQGAFPHQYCHPGNAVGNDWRILSVPPRKDNEPKVVGFIETYIYDFNFRWLQKLNGAEDIRFPQAGGGELKDLNPIGGRAP